MAEGFDAGGYYNGPEEKTIKLRKPIEIKNETSIESITVREPTAGEIAKMVAKEIQTNSAEAGMLLVALVTGMDPDQVQRMSSRDYAEALDFIEGFSKRAPVTPPKP